MKKKLTIGVMVVLAAILIASPVLAAGSSHPMKMVKQGPKKKNWGQPTVISMTGTIFGEPTGGTIVIDIQMTNKAFRIYRLTRQTVGTNSSTKYFVWVDGTRLPYSYGQLSDGDRVSINAKVLNGKFTARRVQVSQPRYP